MKILLLGCTAQEHAMARELERGGHQLYCQMGNAGTEALATPISPNENPLDFAKREGIDLTVVNSEALLAGGIADRFHAAGLRLLGPSASAARLGSSRLVAKRFMLRQAIPTPRFTLCRMPSEVVAAAASFNWQVAIKSLVHDTVTLCSSRYEVEEAFGGELLIEERLRGEELSLSFLCDGEHMVAMPPIIDQKLLCDGGRGLQTGGMGAYVPDDIPFAEEIEETIVEPTRRGLVGYRGILSLVIMLTERGPQLLEYRCQCGDPEAQVLFPLFVGDLAESLVAAADGDLSSALPQWKAEHSCTVVLAASGYPHRTSLRGEVRGLGLLRGLDSIYAYHDSTTLESGRIVTTGGRVLSITGVAPTLRDAIERAYQGAGVIDFPGKFYREDIGRRMLDNSRRALQSKI